jgi:hypothetical protein
VRLNKNGKPRYQTLRFGINAGMFYVPFPTTTTKLTAYKRGRIRGGAGSLPISEEMTQSQYRPSSRLFSLL